MSNTGPAGRRWRRSRVITRAVAWHAAERAAWAATVEKRWDDLPGLATAEVKTRRALTEAIGDLVAAGDAP